MRKSPIVTGLLLIAVGLVLYFLQGTTEGHVTVFLLLGGLFIAAYFSRREYGLLVPGGVLTGLGLGLLAEDWSLLDATQPVPLGLGLGFLLIFVVDRLYTRAGNWWPLIPGGILVLVGIGLQRGIVRWVFREGWPLALVAAGVFLILRSLFGSASEDVEPTAGSEE